MQYMFMFNFVQVKAKRIIPQNSLLLITKTADGKFAENIREFLNVYRHLKDKATNTI